MATNDTGPRIVRSDTEASQMVGWDWVKRLQGGDIVFLVKEKVTAKVLSPISDGRIRLEIGDNKQRWYVNADGSGLDGKPLMEPYFRSSMMMRSYYTLFRAVDAIMFPIKGDEEWDNVVRLLMDDMDVDGFNVGDLIWGKQGITIKTRGQAQKVVSTLSLEKTRGGLRLFMDVLAEGWTRRFDVTRMITLNSWQFEIDVHGYGMVLIYIDSKIVAAIDRPWLTR